MELKAPESKFNITSNDCQICLKTVLFVNYVLPKCSNLNNRFHTIVVTILSLIIAEPVSSRSRRGTYGRSYRTSVYSHYRILSGLCV